MRRVAWARGRPFPGHWIVYVLLLTALSAPAQETDVTRIREGAVAEARRGDTGPALETLKMLLRLAPDNASVQADTVVVAGWAGEDQFAVQVFEAHPKLTEVGYAVNAAAHSARNIFDYKRALGLYQMGRKLSPEDWHLQLGEAMVLTDMEDYTAANKVISPLLNTHGDDIDLLRGRAYLCTRQGDFTCAVSVYQRKEMWSDQANFKHCEFARMVSQVGAQVLARDLCSPDYKADRLQLSAATAAEQIHWGEAYGTRRSEQQAHTFYALSILDNIMQAAPPNSDLWRQAAFDRLVALADVWEWSKTVLSYESLRKQNIVVPMYAGMSVAEAYLALHRAREADKIYRSVLEQQPASSEAWSGLAYAQSDRGHYRASFRSADSAASRAPKGVLTNNAKIALGNPAHLELNLQAAKLRGFAGLYAEEDKRVHGLTAGAPGNVALHHALAETYIQRGWTHRALEQVQIADNFAQPSDLPSFTAVQIAEEANRRDDADHMLPALVRREGRSPAVNNLLREMSTNRGWQVSVQGAYERSSGQYLGSSESYLRLRASSPMAGNRWRLFGDGGYTGGSFAQGDISRTRSVAGLSYEYAGKFFWAKAGLDEQNSDRRRVVAAGATVQVNDAWSFGLAADSDSFESFPLIASLGGVRGSIYSVSVERRGSELSAAGAGVSVTRFSDGNVRAEFSANWNRRIWTTPRIKMDTGIEGSLQHNTADQNRIYYNPDQALSVGPKVDVDWFTWEHYNVSLSQHVTGYLAPLLQKGFDVDVARSARYDARIRLSRRLLIEAGAVYSSQPYDGVRGGYTGFTYGMRWGR